MKKNLRKKLTLNRQTVAVLSNGESSRILGGAATTPCSGDMLCSHACSSSNPPATTKK